MDYQEMIEDLKSLHRHCSDMLDESEPDSVWRKDCTALDAAISAMQELQEYHETGMTPAEVIRMQHGYAVKMTDLEDYQRIGTLEEVREAVERKNAKKPDNFTWVRGFSGQKIDKSGNCPKCGCERLFASNLDYCRVCGQHVDWSEEE